MYFEGTLCLEVQSLCETTKNTVFEDHVLIIEPSKDDFLTAQGNRF